MSGRWGVVTAQTAVQPGSPSEHSCRCLSAGESQPLRHLQDCRQSRDERLSLNVKASFSMRKYDGNS